MKLYDTPSALKTPSEAPSKVLRASNSSLFSTGSSSLFDTSDPNNHLNNAVNNLSKNNNTVSYEYDILPQRHNDVKTSDRDSLLEDYSTPRVHNDQSQLANGDCVKKSDLKIDNVDDEDKNRNGNNNINCSTIITQNNSTHNNTSFVNVSDNNFFEDLYDSPKKLIQNGEQNEVGDESRVGERVSCGSDGSNRRGLSIDPSCLYDIPSNLQQHPPLEDNPDKGRVSSTSNTRTSVGSNTSHKSTGSTPVGEFSQLSVSESRNHQHKQQNQHRHPPNPNSKIHRPITFENRNSQAKNLANIPLNSSPMLKTHVENLRANLNNGDPKPPPNPATINNNLNSKDQCNKPVVPDRKYFSNRPLPPPPPIPLYDTINNTNGYNKLYRVSQQQILHQQIRSFDHNQLKNHQPQLNKKLFSEQNSLHPQFISQNKHTTNNINETQAKQQSYSSVFLAGGEEGDMLLVDFYASQVNHHLQLVHKTSQDFRNIMNFRTSVTPKEFVLRSKLVILSAHELVYIADAIARNLASPGRSVNKTTVQYFLFNIINNICRYIEVSEYANELCKVLKVAVNSTKEAALHHECQLKRRLMQECLCRVEGASESLAHVIKRYQLVTGGFSLRS